MTGKLSNSASISPQSKHTTTRSFPLKPLTRSPTHWILWENPPSLSSRVTIPPNYSRRSSNSPHECEWTQNISRALVSRSLLIRNWASMRELNFFQHDHSQFHRIRRVGLRPKPWWFQQRKHARNELVIPAMGQENGAVKRPVQQNPKRPKRCQFSLVIHQDRAKHHHNRISPAIPLPQVPTAWPVSTVVPPTAPVLLPAQKTFSFIFHPSSSS